MSKKKRPSAPLHFLKILFWVFVAAGGAWLAFAPTPRPHHRPPQQVAVAPLPDEKPPMGDEQAESPPAAPLPTAEPPPPSPVQNTAPKLVTIVKGQARIAIIIDDVGLDMVGSRRAVALPAYVTLSYIPYSTRLREQTKEAREAGHELMLHMPMQPMGSADPGPGALLVGLSQDELRQRLATALASFVGFDGMNNHMGSKFTADREGMNLVMDELQQRHLFFLDSKTSAQSIGAEVAREHGVPTLSRDVFLDDDMSAKAVRIQLEQTERLARRKGYAIAIGHPHAVTLQALEEWLPEAEQRGFVFVPINSLLNQDAR